MFVIVILARCRSTLGETGRTTPSRAPSGGPVAGPVSGQLAVFAEEGSGLALYLDADRDPAANSSWKITSCGAPAARGAAVIVWPAQVGALEHAAFAIGVMPTPPEMTLTSLRVPPGRGQSRHTGLRRTTHGSHADVRGGRH